MFISGQASTRSYGAPAGHPSTSAQHWNCTSGFAEWVEPGSRLRVLELDTDWQCGASAIALANRCDGTAVSLSHSRRAVTRARAA